MGCLAVLTCVGDLSKHYAVTLSTTLSRKVHKCRSLAVWFNLLGQMGRSQAVVDITHKHCEVHDFDFTLSAEQAHEVEATEGVDFHGYGIGDEIVNGRFQYQIRVVNSYEPPSYHEGIGPRLGPCLQNGYRYNINS